MLTAVLTAALALAPAAADPRPYAPLDRPGPALSVPLAQLEAALVCDDLAGATVDPVLLVPGTTLTPAQFEGNLLRALADRPVCTVELPEQATGEVPVAGEHLVHAIRTMAAASGRQVDVVGHSQGGMVPRWALRFWPDTRPLVDDLVGLAPSNHGTLDSEVLCQVVCPPAFWQQAAGSDVIAALNSGTETFAGIDYTVVYTRLDEVVTPNLDAATGSSSLRTGDGAVTNVATQDVCPLNTAEHLAVGTYDPVATALVLDAVGHDGPADPARLDPATCLQLLAPQVDPVTFPLQQAALLALLAQGVAGARYVPEPPLPAYALAAAGGAGAAPVVAPVAGPAGAPLASGAAPSAVPTAATAARGGLAATGGGATGLAALLAVTGLAARRRLAR